MPFKKGMVAHNFQNLTGKRFGRLVVIERKVNSKDGKANWKCVCDCGKIIITKGKYLKSGETKSCGCLNIDKIIERNKSNKKRGGMSTTRIYQCWYNMISRCEKGFGTDYKYYKGKGIIVCDDWHDFNNFASWALNNGYSEELLIDRIDGNKNYEPSNCRWVDVYVQANNRTNRNPT